MCCLYCLIVRHVADDTGHIGKSGQLTGPLAAVARDDFLAPALAGTHQRGLVYTVVLVRWICSYSFLNFFMYRWTP